MIKKPSNLCIGIRTLNRSDYLKRTLDSLLSNSDLDGVDFHFIQDGAVSQYTGIRYATDESIEANLKLIKEVKLPNKEILVKPFNTGTPIHKELQLDIFFPRYEYAIMCDDDLVFSKDYIVNLKVLFKQFKDDPKAGMIQTSFKHDGHNFQDIEKAKEFADNVSYGFSHRWEQGFWRESAEKIKPFIRPYFDLIRKIDFNKFYREGNSYPDVRKKIAEIYGNAFAGDHVLEICTERAGYLGLHTKILRHKTLGKKGGYSFRGGRFDGSGYGKIKLHEIGKIKRYSLKI